jgi:DNA-binding CsgD family transcriptional regulator
VDTVALVAAALGLPSQAEATFAAAARPRSFPPAGPSSSGRRGGVGGHAFVPLVGHTPELAVLERHLLTKDAGAQEIQRAIRTVHAGEALLDPAVQLRVIRALSGDVRASRRGPALPDDLTPREAEVLRLIAQGLNNREIAERLFVTEATVTTHINNIFAKAGLRDRAQAVVYAIRHGLAEEP